MPSTSHPGGDDTGSPPCQNYAPGGGNNPCENAAVGGDDLPPKPQTPHCPVNSTNPDGTHNDNYTAIPCKL